MRIDAGQQMRLDQRMKLAPRMIQSMEILQMPQAQLEERIDQELSANPTLELREGAEDEPATEQDRKQEERDDGEGERELLVHDDGDGKPENNADDFERLSNMAEEYGDAWEGNTYETGEPPLRRMSARNDGERDRKLDAMANTAARPTSMHDQLVAQWHLVEVPPRVAALGEHVLGYLDPDGYVRTDSTTLLKNAPFQASEAELDEAIKLLQQSLEPTGLAARDVRECLLLQIDARQRLEPDLDLSLERTLVAEYLKDIEANRMPRIARSLGLTVEQVTQAIHNLRQFHPRPGRLLASDVPQTISPDAIVEFDEEEDRYVARLTHGQLPPLALSRTYQKMSRDNGVDRRTREFVNHNLRSARWLIEAIQQRNLTLLRVINVVIEAQREFFEQGPQALRPLPMTTVADQLGIHVATVSRAVHEKYLETPRGIVPLRMFFSGGTETEKGDAMSWAAVQARLEQIINEEDKSTPLNDDQLVEALKAKGIDIARRTVAKYRKQLGIPPARQRRQY
ncbi:MAG: RNA polymerase factor sigma-54 [Phycisphaeraceae bacterium]